MWELYKALHEEDEVVQYEIKFNASEIYWNMEQLQCGTVRVTKSMKTDHSNFNEYCND